MESVYANFENPHEFRKTFALIRAIRVKPGIGRLMTEILSGEKPAIDLALLSPEGLDETMFNRLFNKPKPVSNPIRETLFGDMPLSKWPPEETNQAFPWNSFIIARNHVAKSDVGPAIDQWKQIIATENLESRHYIQAWNFLRQHGVRPAPENAKEVFGIVVENGMTKGLDLLAAYRDCSARYYNYSGAGVVWDRPDSSLDSNISALLSASAQVVSRIGPWDQDRPPPPPTGQMRISFLTPSGLHFGQAPVRTLVADPLAGPVVQAATTLMQALIAKANKSTK